MTKLHLPLLPTEALPTSVTYSYNPNSNTIHQHHILDMLSMTSYSPLIEDSGLNFLRLFTHSLPLSDSDSHYNAMLFYTPRRKRPSRSLWSLSFIIYLYDQVFKNHCKGSLGHGRVRYDKIVLLYFTLLLTTTNISRTKQRRPSFHPFHSSLPNPTVPSIRSCPYSLLFALSCPLPPNTSRTAPTHFTSYNHLGYSPQDQDRVKKKKSQPVFFYAPLPARLSAPSRSLARCVSLVTCIH